MLKKLLLLLLIAGLAFTTVLPAFSETFVVTPGDEAQEDQDQDEDDEEQEEEEVTVYETLAEAIEAAKYSDEDEVVIEIAKEADTDQELEGPIDFDEDLSVKSITIRGTGNTRIICTGGGVRHFTVNNPDFTLSLVNLILDGQNTGGGVEVSAGTLSADHVTFTCSSASHLDGDNHSGGAVSVTGADGTATFSSCAFTANEAETGGAVFCSGTLTFSGSSSFERNEASSGGGAVALTGGSSSTLSGLTFGTGALSGANRAPDGAALLIDGGAVATIENSTFRVNSTDAEGRGGAVCVLDGSLTLRAGNIRLSGNRAGQGGAVYLADKDNVTLNCEGENTVTFSGNEATEAGGAIYAERNAKLNAGANVAFTDNRSPEGMGGALWVHMGSQLNGVAGAVSFTGNSALYGGAIYIAIDAQSTASFSTPAEYSFSGNSAVYDGGAIYTVKSDVVIDGQNITGSNQASECGGFLWCGGSVTVRSSTISGQRAMTGGAIYSEGTVTIDGSAFSGNSTEAESSHPVSGGGAIYVEGRLSVTSSDFSDNSSVSSFADQGGGALFVSGDADISTSTFTNNTHTNDDNINNGGGAILVNGSLTVEGTLFDGNRAAGKDTSLGGAIYAINGSTVSLTDSMFTGNTSNSNGGAIALTGQCTTTIERTSFHNNVSSSANGGAIYAQGVITVQTSYFYRNRSSRDGGAIFMDQHNNATTPGRFSVSSTMFSENTAGTAPNEGRGGALYLRPDVADINRCTFSENQSSASGADSRGGAIYLDTNETAVFTPSTIKNCMFAGNEVSGGTTNYGGAVYLTGEDITLVSDTFTAGNSAVDRGGAVYLGAGTLTIAACILVGNAADQGRDIYAEGTITSRGYNRIGVYGKGGNDTSWLADITTSTTDRESTSWGTATFFGEDAALVANDGYHTAPEIGSSLEETTVYLLVIPLNEEDTLSEKDRASNAIPFARRFTLNIDELDIWGVSRFSGSNPITIGCHYLGGGTGAGEDEDDGLYDIAGITMSGIPNTLRSIGQTASLVALIHYRNGRTAWGVPASRTDVTKNQEERVTWESSMPSYVKVDENGNITALLLTNNTNGATIRVKTVRYMSTGSVASDARAVRVTGQYSGMNTISSTFQNYFNGYINDLMEHDISVSIADPDKSTMQSTGFKRNFASAWNGATPSAITSLTSSTPRFNTVGTYSGTSGMSASKGAAVNITFQDRSEGDLFPLTYSWNLSGKAVKALLGSDMTNTAINDAFADKVFSRARVEYQTAGAAIPVLGKNGVGGSDARRYGALSVTKADGGAGLHIELTAYLANVGASSSVTGAQLVKGSGTKRLLVVPDNSSDGAITGAMWLVQPSGTMLPEENSSTTPEPSEPSGGNTTSSGGGGGGGCSALPLGIACAGLVLMLSRKH